MRKLTERRLCTEIYNLPLTSSGANKVASLVATGATSSMLTAGMLVTILTSGATWIKTHKGIKE